MLYANGLKIQPFSKISQNTAMNRYNLIKRLQIAFKEAGISEAELARRANMNQPTVHRILGGESTDPKAKQPRRNGCRSWLFATRLI